MDNGVTKPGNHGSTVSLGYRYVENPASVHDLLAAMQALMGIIHTRKTVKFQGLEAGLTSVAGNILKPPAHELRLMAACSSP